MQSITAKTDDFLNFIALYNTENKFFENTNELNTNSPVINTVDEVLDHGVGIRSFDRNHWVDTTPAEKDSLQFDLHLAVVSTIYVLQEENSFDMFLSKFASSSIESTKEEVQSEARTARVR